jgi:membrane fusion protein, heavy metal efflux system
LKNLLIIIALISSATVFSQEHTHEHGEEETPEEVHGFTSEKFTEKYEILAKYHELKSNEEGHIDVYVSDYKTNKAMDVKLTVTCPTDKSQAIEVHREDVGIYELHVTFKENKDYQLNFNIDGPNGVDLIQLNDIAVGKIVEADNHDQAVTAPSLFSNYLPYLISILCLGLGLWIGMWYQKKKGINSRAMSIFIICLMMTIRVNDTKAHEGHENEFGGGDLASVFEIPKETQFLFDILTSQVGSGDFNSSVQLYGTVIPSNGGSTIVSTPQSGRLTSLNVKIGDKVRKGQRLGTIAIFIDVNTQVALDDNKISIMQIEAERNSLKAEYEAASKENDRLQKIADIASKRDVDEARSRLEKARSNLDLFNKQVDKSSTLGRIEKVINLYAPINGIVSEFALVSGSTVNMGQELFKIINIDKVYIEGQIYDRDLPHLNKNANFEAQCVNADHKANIKLISAPQVINSENQSQKVMFELENKTGEFKIGEFVNIRMFSNDKTSRAISLPNSAITDLNGKPVIFIKNSAEHFHITYINTGENNGSHTTITKGLNGGERVIVNGTYQTKMIYLNQ